MILNNTVSEADVVYTKITNVDGNPIIENHASASGSAPHSR